MYEKLVFEFPQEHNEILTPEGAGGYVVHPQAYFRGASQIPESKFNCSFQVFVKPFFLDRIPHRHPEDEYLIFLGAHVADECTDGHTDVFNFDADIEFTLGEIGKDAEVFHITKPTIVRIPAGVYHCPLNFKRVDKPVLFLAACMMPMFGAIFDQPDGSTREAFYNGPMQCKYNDRKKCDSCGKCLMEKWNG